MSLITEFEIEELILSKTGETLLPRLMNCKVRAN